MLTEKQIKEIKEHLDKAQRPLFFFDNDPDGLCSFLLLQKYIGRGKGVAVKSFPGLNAEYFRRVTELNADYIFILDKPVVEKDFWEKIDQVNIPVVWIDHHEIDTKTIPKVVHYYNPLYNKEASSEPVTYLCHQINDREIDKWIAVIGCISDKFFPDFYDEFREKFPQLTIDSKDPFEIFYKSEIGKIARIFGFGLKDRITNVINMQKFLMAAKSPYDVLEESAKNKSMHDRFDHVDKKYSKFLDRAREDSSKYKNMVYFEYGGDMSISADLSNQLSFEFPGKKIVVAYLTGVKVNISGRGKDIKKIFLKIIKDLPGATGGGHEQAVGARINLEDLDKFRERLIEEVEEVKKVRK